MTILIDQPRKEIAIALARAGMTGYWIAAYMGCDESTLRDALAKDEMFRLRYLQGRADKQMELLGTIAKAATKSWRASVWLLERLYPKQYNLRKSQNELQLDAFGLTIETNANQPEASARDDESPTPNPQSLTPDFESTALCQKIATSSVAPSEPFWESYNNPAAPLLDLWSGPPPISPKPYSAIREKIINEGLSVDEKFKLLREHEAKQQFHRNVAHVYGVPITEVPDIPLPE